MLKEGAPTRSGRRANPGMRQPRNARPEQHRRDNARHEPDDSVEAQVAAFEENDRWFAEHFDTLMARYPGKWVAIRGGEVLAAAGDQLALLDALDEKGIPMTRVTVELLSTHPFVA